MPFRVTEVNVKGIDVPTVSATFVKPVCIGLEVSTFPTVKFVVDTLLAVNVFASSLDAETFIKEQLAAVNVFRSTLAAETFIKEQFPAYKGPTVVVPVAFKVVVFSVDASR